MQKHIYKLIIAALIWFGLTTDSYAQCDISATSSGANPAFTQVYVLVEATSGNIIQQNNSGNFPAVAPGAYRVHALNFDPSNPPAPLPANLIGQSISLVGTITAGCFNNDFFTDFVNRSCASCFYTRTICANAPILVNSSLANPAYEQLYVLVDAASGLIVSVNPSGNFTGLVSAGNSYRVHALNYDPLNPPLPLPFPGLALNDIGTSSSGCYNDDYLTDFICYNVTSCFNDCFRLTSICPGQNIVASVSGENTAYEQVYVLTDAVGSFISQNNTGVFPTVSLVAGDYRVYALNYSTSNPPNPLPSMLAVGSPLSMVTGGCFNQDFLSDYLCYSLNCLLGGNLLSFSGEKSGQSNKLSWSVEHPEKISRYVLERSPDGFSDFKEIYTLGSTADYSFVYLDRSPLEKSYYRLKMIGLDNSVEYSSVIYLEQQIAKQIAIYPNPADNTINLILDADNGAAAQVRIYNMLGQVLSEISLDTKIGLNSFQLNLDELVSGEYCLQLNLTNESRLFKFTKK
jgi:hypothetical protein